MGILKGAISLDRLPPHRGVILTINLHAVEGPTSPPPHGGKPPLDSATVSKRVAEDLHVDKESGSESFEHPYSVECAYGYYYVEVLAVLLRIRGQTPMMQLEPFFFDDSTVQISTDGTIQRDYRMTWPEISLEKLYETASEIPAHDFSTPERVKGNADADYWGSFEDNYYRMRTWMEQAPDANNLGLPASKAIEAPHYESSELDLITADYFLSANVLEPWQLIDPKFKRRKGNLLAVSHTWDSLEHPDPHRAQLVFLKLLAACNPDAVFFYDFCSMPQTPRSHEEEQRFQAGLRQMNELFLNGKVVVLGTNWSYFHRAWCLMEFFCHLLSPLDREIVVMSMADPRFIALMLTVIMGEQYKEENIIGVDGWKSRIMTRVKEGRTTIPADKAVVMEIMERIEFEKGRKMQNSRKGCVEFLSPKGISLIVAN